jgi:MFS family permease
MPRRIRDNNNLSVGHSRMSETERTSLLIHNTVENTQKTYSSPQESYTSDQTFHEVVIPENLVKVIATLWLGSFLSAADTTIVSTTANTIASSMNGSDKLTWIATSYLLTNTIFQPLVGKFSDVFGRRTVMLIAQFWFAFGCLCCAFSQNVTQFTIARALAGIGGGGMSALSSIITTDIIPLRMRGIYQGYANLMYGIGQFTGPILGSAFLTWNEKTGWRWMFGIQVPLVIIAAIFVHRNVHEYRQDQLTEIDMDNRFAWENLKKIDLPGSFLLSCAIISLLLMFNVDNMKMLLIYVSCFITSIILFGIVEKYIMTVHIIPPSAFKGILRITALIVFFGAGAIYAMNYILPLYFQVVHDFSQFQLGCFNSFGVFGTSFGSLIAGWYLKHEDENVSSKVIVNRGIYLSILCCFGIVFGVFLCMFAAINLQPTINRDSLTLEVYAKLSILLIGSIFTSIGYGAFLVAILILVVGLVGVKRQATVTGMNYMFRSMGQSSGVGITLGLYNHNLVNELTHYFLEKNKPDGAEILEKLKYSTNFIRNGLPAKYLQKVLKFYRTAVGDAMILVFLLGACSFMLSLLLKVVHSNEESKPLRESNTSHV